MKITGTRAGIGLAGSLAGLLMVGTPLTAASGAGATVAPAVTLTGSIGHLPAASAVVIVEAELGLGRTTNAHHIATTLEDIPIASGTFTSGTFRIAVPESRVLRRVEQLGHGNVNFDVVVDSGSWGTSQYVPVPLATAAAPGNVEAGKVLQTHLVRLPRFPQFTAMSPTLRTAIRAAGGIAALPRDTTICTWTKYGNEYEDSTRLGEVHVANKSGMSDKFVYINQADSTLTVGLSTTGTSNWTEDGSITLTNSMGTSGSYTFSAGALIYVDGQIYYQRYVDNHAAGCPAGGPYKAQGDHTVGNSYPGTNQPPANPYGGCLSDPYGYAKLPSGSGTFASDLGRAAGYGGVATVWEFTFGGHTGFTSNIIHNYTNHSSSDTYLCGTTYMSDVPILYNTG